MIKNQDFIQEFVEEAKGHTENIEALLLENEGNKQDKECINSIFRAVHSIKGTAGFFGLKNIVALAHAMENIFGEIRAEKIPLSDDIIDIMIQSNDRMKDMVDDVLHSDTISVLPLTDALNRFMVYDASGHHEEETPTLTLKGYDDKEISLTGSSYTVIKDALARGHKIFEVELSMNKDLINYIDGPMKMFKKIQSVGMVIDTMTDNSEINNIEDVLEAIKKGDVDVYLKILVSTVLEKELFSSAIEISLDNIYEMQVIKPGDQSGIVTKTSDRLVEKTLEVFEPLGADEDAFIPEKPLDTKQFKAEDSIRVHVSVLNDLLNMASEMVLGRNQLLRTLEDYRKNISGLSPILQNIDRLTSSMQEKIMQTRMQPVSNVFNKFPRIIRDLAKSLKKEIELVMEGEEVELDKSVIEALTDPLTHLVRNAADHGLETSEERTKFGKNRVGNIKLKAFHEGGYVIIDVIDDGHGMEVENIAQKAYEKGLVSKEDVSRMTDMEILRLIFKPGFSTASQVSDISGRGVGMDVVRTNIEKLGGTVEIYTGLYTGTTIRLILPLTLAIIQSLIVETKGQKFAVPQVNLKEIVRIKQGDKGRKLEFIHDAEVLRLRGSLLPIIHLKNILELNHDTHHHLAEDEVTRILVLQMGARSFGLVVDSILASEETLVKPLPTFLKSCDCYAGVTIMGDGKTAMILDIDGLIRLSELKFGDDGDFADNGKATDGEKLLELQNLLLFKCTGNETYAVDLSMISRVEEIDVSEIDKVGKNEYIKFRGDSLRVIHMESYLSVNASVSQATKKYVLIPKLVRYPIGIIVEKVIDNVNINLTLNTEDVKHRGVLGSTIYDNRMIVLINLYELFEMADPEHYKIASSEQKNRGTILLAEDTPFFQRQVSDYLRNAGYEVIVSENGKEAYEVLESYKVDCVVSDIQMPVMDGLELVKKIRENKALKHLPVIALTSMSGENQKQVGMQSGFDFYELKLDRDSLINRVHSAITNSKTRGD
ncbi:MAG: chemotaxis protein CheW [Hyphomonadaceae bacterium]|nr:chemotaxis protein CheW [Clostridia bacterium]